MRESSDNLNGTHQLKTSAQVVEMSVNVITNRPFQACTRLNNYTSLSFDMTSWVKTFTEF